VRYLICRPVGGLNDVLNQVSRCMDYSRATGRTLVIDTDFKQSSHFRLPFKEVFLPKGLDCDFKIPSEVTFESSLSVLPQMPVRELFDYSVADVPGRGLCKQGETTPLTFDFLLDHPQSILLHHAYGGGTSGILALERLSLSSDLRGFIQDRLDLLAGNLNYIGVHVRHTDYQSNYRQFLAGLESNYSGERVYVATDSSEVIHFASEIFAERLIPNQTRFFNLVGESTLHSFSDPETARDRLFDAICDLFFLAISKEFVPCQLAEGQSVAWSGYAVLANQIRQNPPLVSRLLHS